MCSEQTLSARQLPHKAKELGGSSPQPNPLPSPGHQMGPRLYCVAAGPLPTPHSPEVLSHAPLKQIKHLLFRFFSFLFFLFYKNMHTYTGYGGPGEDTRACTHTHTLSLSHTQILSFLAPGLDPRSLEDGARAASPPLCHPSILPPPFPSAKLVLCRAGGSRGGGDARRQARGGGAVSEEPWVLLRGDEGFGTIGSGSAELRERLSALPGG